MVVEREAGMASAAMEAAMVVVATAAATGAVTVEAARVVVAVATEALPVAEAKAVGMVAPPEELAKRRSSSLSVSHN